MSSTSAKPFNIRTLKLEGGLLKFTNIVTGFKQRYFVVNTALARLDYFMSEDMKHQKPRGSIELENAVISPSEEDSTTFLIHTIDNELFKLRSQDAKERQHWVNVLRFVSQSAKSEESTKAERREGVQRAQSQLVQAEKCNFELVKEVLKQVRHSQAQLDRLIDGLPLKSSCLARYDKQVLLMKATARACSGCVSECADIIKALQTGQKQLRSTEFKKQMHCERKTDLKQNISSYPFSQLSLSPTDIYNGTKSDYVSTVLPKAANSSTPSPDRKRRSSTATDLPASSTGTV